MIVDLPGLTAPLTEADFLAALRERVPQFVRGSSKAKYEHLLDWGSVEHLLATETYPRQQLTAVRGAVPIRSSAYMRRGRFDGSSIAELMDQGASLIFDRLDDFVPRLRSLCRDIAVRTGEQISAGAVATGRGGAVERRYDAADAAILQIAGTKRWTIYGDPIEHPAKGMPAPPAPRTPTVLLDEVLAPGDFLFVPAGHWHRSESGPERSLHAVIAFTPPNGQHLIAAWANAWLSDETVREPITRHRTGDELAAHESGLKVRLIELVRQSSIAEFVAAYAAAAPGAAIRLEERAAAADATDPSR